MSPSDLELYTTEELIRELVRRRTFLGVVVHSAREYKDQQDWRGQRTFRVHHNSNLGTEEAGRLLEAVAENLAGREP